MGSRFSVKFFIKKGRHFAFGSSEYFLKENFIGLVVGSNCLDCSFPG